ncbi:MAG: hypothetical protein ABIQ31_20035 [Ferruginibacter sp.]
MAVKLQIYIKIDEEPDKWIIEVVNKRPAMMIVEAAITGNLMSWSMKFPGFSW